MKVRITSVPVGSAPLQVREGWVGVEIPLDEDLVENCWLSESLGLRAHDVVTGRRVDRSDPNVGGYGVHMTDAIAALCAKGAQEAADWWQDFADHHPSFDVLVFGKQFCEVIE